MDDILCYRVYSNIRCIMYLYIIQYDQREERVLRHPHLGVVSLVCNRDPLNIFIFDGSAYFMMSIG